LIGHCFEKCRFLASVTFEQNPQLTRVEEYAFSESGLRSICIPASVEALDQGCFYSCSFLRGVTFEEGSHLRTVGVGAFARINLGCIDLPGGANIKVWVFAYSNIEEIKIDGCFADFFSGVYMATRLIPQELMVPRTIKVIRDFCFASCTTLENIAFESGCQLREIGTQAFACSHLQCIELPSSVEKLGDRCFSDCRFLVSVALREDSQLRVVGKAVLCR
ncbi:MAG: leucine-rich repeat domain-containing protein, partial [Holosporales bacterium]|nr:leucine-rich repeat domain-containing protein [Holosporales bacterium]